MRVHAPQIADNAQKIGIVGPAGEPVGSARPALQQTYAPLIERTFTSAPRISFVVRTSSGEPPSESAD